MRAPVSQETLLPCLLGGIASGFLFFTSVGSETSGTLFVFLPSLPLLLIGLALGLRPAGIACIIAFGCVGLLTGIAGLLFFFGFIALPVFYFLRHTLKWRGSEAEREWYPMLRVMSGLTMLIVFCFTMMALATGGQGGLKVLIPPDFAGGFKGADPEIAAMAQQMTGDLSFALFAIIGWLWIIMLYALAVLANRLLKTKSYALRPSLAIEPHGLPVWLLVLLALSGLLAMFGQGVDRLTAETLFLILLLPYLLCGLAFVHALSIKRGFAFRRLWLTCFYIVLACTRWPLLAVVAIGLYVQLTEMLDRHQKIR